MVKIKLSELIRLYSESESDVVFLCDCIEDSVIGEAKVTGEFREQWFKLVHGVYAERMYDYAGDFLSGWNVASVYSMNQFDAVIGYDRWAGDYYREYRKWVLNTVLADKGDLEFNFTVKG